MDDTGGRRQRPASFYHHAYPDAQRARRDRDNRRSTDAQADELLDVVSYLAAEVVALGARLEDVETELADRPNRDRARCRAPRPRR